MAVPAVQSLEQSRLELTSGHSLHRRILEGWSHPALNRLEWNRLVASRRVSMSLRSRRHRTELGGELGRPVVVTLQMTMSPRNHRRRTQVVESLSYQ